MYLEKTLENLNLAKQKLPKLVSTIQNTLSWLITILSDKFNNTKLTKHNLILSSAAASIAAIIVSPASAKPVEVEYKLVNPAKWVNMPHKWTITISVSEDWWWLTRPMEITYNNQKMLIFPKGNKLSQSNTVAKTKSLDSQKIEKKKGIEIKELPEPKTQIAKTEPKYVPTWNLVKKATQPPIKLTPDTTKSQQSKSSMPTTPPQNSQPKTNYDPVIKQILKDLEKNEPKNLHRTETQQPSKKTTTYVKDSHEKSLMKSTTYQMNISQSWKHLEEKDEKINNARKRSNILWPNFAQILNANNIHKNTNISAVKNIRVPLIDPWLDNNVPTTLPAFLKTHQISSSDMLNKNSDVLITSNDASWKTILLYYKNWQLKLAQYIYTLKNTTYAPGLYSIDIWNSTYYKYYYSKTFTLEKEWNRIFVWDRNNLFGWVGLNLFTYEYLLKNLWKNALLNISLT